MAAGTQRETHGGAGGLGRVAGRGAVLTFGGQVVRIAIQLGGLVVLARLLDPADYGVVAMVVAVIGIAEVVRDFGLSSAAVQAKTLTAGQRTNLFWLSLGIGVVLSLATVALSTPISALYGDPRLVAVTIALSAAFTLDGFSAQFRASLTREFAFGRLAVVEIVAPFTGLVVAVAIAWAGGGYWALVAQQVVQAACGAVVLPFVARWWPGMPRRGESMRSLVAFGGGLVGAQLLTYVSRNIDTVVIGRLFGAQALGYYNRAFQLMLLPLNQINAPATRVALPTLSRLDDDPQKYREFIVLGQIVLLNVVGAVLWLSVAQAEDLIALVLGHQWDETVPLYQILAVAGFFQAAAFATYWVYLSKGLTRRFFSYTAWTRPVVIGVIVLGALWGVAGVAWAYLITTALLWPIGLLWLRGRTDAPLRLLFANAGRTLVVYGVAALGSYGATFALPGPPILGLTVGTVVFVGVLGVIALVYPAYRRDLIAIVRSRRYFAGRGVMSAQHRSDTSERHALASDADV
ncbi:lipopolysaccharide biosynthesis protein [Microbacterium sp. No. 7]|uniref:lipopolysaccharide biosynthesis protein n=1 Tax=Microbacterium sp. No. 7 TaxID=1714373 RepID=UPI0006D2C02D|nr:lipopolysaccharide biosynthesis protein [Microbacterium sp. No. 7]